MEEAILIKNKNSLIFFVHKVAGFFSFTLPVFTRSEPVCRTNKQRKGESQ